MVSMNKFHNKKIELYGRKWDSKAELLYYEQHKNSTNMKLQVPFVLQDKFKIKGKTYRAIKYIPDFVFYDEEGGITKVVDVKGIQTKEFKIKAKMFAKRYGIPITIAELNRKYNIFIEEDL